MIDIHTHILPYVDDGSPDLLTSLNLIKLEIEQGVTDIFVTPHYFKGRGFYSTLEINKEIFNNLKEEVERQNLAVNLYLGNEIFYNSKIMKDLENNIITTLNNSRYVLIEFSLSMETEDIPEAINNLTARGYIPILAHPERYSYLKDLNHYRLIRAMGAKIQVNSGSITGFYGGKIKKLVMNLLKNDLVDIIASDIHDFRLSSMKDAFEIVKNNFGENIADKLFNNRMIFNENT